MEQDIRLDDPVIMNNYTNQPYQATWVQGPYNITVRGEDKDQVVQDMQAMVNKVQNWVGSQPAPAPAQPIATGKTMWTKQPTTTEGQTCPSCGHGTMKYKEGVGKTGSPYAKMSCSNYLNCKNTEWLT